VSLTGYAKMDQLFESIVAAVSANIVMEARAASLFAEYPALKVVIWSSLLQTGIFACIAVQRAFGLPCLLLFLLTVLFIGDAVWFCHEQSRRWRTIIIFHALLKASLIALTVIFLYG